MADSSHVLVLNGPNLGRLGSREPEVYGATTHADLVRICQADGAALGLEVEVRQTDDEAELVGWLHEAADAGTPVVLNPAAFTHYSYALRDACAQLTAPLVEVHITNPHTREEFRARGAVFLFLLLLLGGFGVGVDLVHAMLFDLVPVDSWTMMGGPLDKILSFVEDGGELVILTLTCALSCGIRFLLGD